MICRSWRTGQVTDKLRGIMRLLLFLPRGLRRGAVISAVLLSACAQPNQGNADLLVETAQGPVRGMPHGQGVHAWLGIPYAAAPIDSLRWHAPQLPEHWRETRDADTYRSACTQPRRWWSSDAAAVRGTEDCLYLNVFAPAESPGSRPVLVWLHGGGNYSGQGNLNNPGTLVQS